MQNGKSARTIVGAIALCLLLVGSVRRAHAGGLELVGQGTQAVARGGAVTAKADDPMVLAHNPAGLAELRGQQLTLQMNLTLFDACVDPAGYYGWGTYIGGSASRFIDPETGVEESVPLGRVIGSGDTAVAEAAEYYADPYDTVCLDQHVTPIPQLAWAWRATEDLGIGFGFIFPQVQPSGHWGGENGIIRGKLGKLRPAATRYQMLSSANLGAFPNLGFGYRILDMIRIGGSFEYGFIAVNNYTMSAALGGTSPNNDIVAHVKAQDWFIPAVTASLHIVPIDALDIVIGGRWQDAIDAKGTADLTSGLFDPELLPKTDINVPILSIKQNMPWKLRAGIRYADRLAPRPIGSGSDESDFASGEVIHDALQDERWDIELDVEYQANSVNQEQVVDFESNYRIDFRPADPNAAVPSAMVPDEIRIKKQWKDQVSVRLGGSFNPLPGLLGLSAGAHYETRGVTPDYMQIDFWPVQRIGVHGGVTLRVSNAVDFVFAYAHVFQETIIVAPPAHRERSMIYDEYVATGGAMGGVVNGIDHTSGVPTRTRPADVLTPPSQGTPDGTARLAQNVSNTTTAQPPFITNAGRYRSSFDMLSVALNVHY